MTERIEFKNTTLPIQVLAYPSDAEPGWWVVKVSIDSIDRDTGKADYFAVEHRHRYEGEPSRDLLAEWVREVARDILQHELDEALHVDGVRVFDPHRDDVGTRVPDHGMMNP